MMPLYRGKSESDFKHNVKTEREEGKPLKQSLAVAYAMKRRGKKMADGGFVREEEESGYRPMPMEHPKMDRRAEEEDDRRLNQHGMYEVGAGGMAHGGMTDGYQDDSDDMDMIDHIMRQKSDCYSEGGRVANQEHGPDETIWRILNLMNLMTWLRMMIYRLLIPAPIQGMKLAMSRKMKTSTI
jgi:hypothetical protein